MLHPDTFNRAELTTWMTDAGPLDLLHDIPDRDGTRRPFEELVVTRPTPGSGREELGEVPRVATTARRPASKQASENPSLPSRLECLTVETSLRGPDTTSTLWCRGCPRGQPCGCAATAPRISPGGFWVVCRLR
jgi:hypothetical protein